MKTLYVLRHAKSSWEDPSLEDKLRPLSRRGIKSVPHIANALVASKKIPELVISSPAERALQTTALLKSALAGYYETFVQKVDDRIYDTTPESLLEVLHDIPDSFETALIVGHNPELERFVELLCFGTDTGHLLLPTAALAILTIESSQWSAIQPASVILEALLPIKLLKRLAKD
ncbi:MAG: histidine phosphatase family protein [SAR324 cluster bacterium]|nr:histidine phosphatase family protein [SAR324 cluster bacterium]